MVFYVVQFFFRFYDSISHCIHRFFTYRFFPYLGEKMVQLHGNYMFKGKINV